MLRDWGFLEILEERYARRSTIVTSRWHAAIDDPTDADDILDRSSTTPNASISRRFSAAQLQEQNCIRRRLACWVWMA